VIIAIWLFGVGDAGPVGEADTFRLRRDSFRADLVRVRPPIVREGRWVRVRHLSYARPWAYEHRGGG